MLPAPSLRRGWLRQVGGHSEGGRGDIKVGRGQSEVGNARRGLAEFALEPFDLGLDHNGCDWRSFEYG